MKKKLLLTLLLIFALGSVKAQSYKFLSFGVKAGANMSSVSGLSDISSALQAGFTGGLSVELRPIKLMGVRAEVLYSADGCKSSDISVENWTAKYEGDLGYIDSPIMAKIYVWGGLSVNLGVMPSFLVSSNITLSGSSGSTSDNSPVQANKAAFSIPVGLSLKILNFLSVEARYNIPLSTVCAYSETYLGTTLVDASDYNFKRQAFSFLVGITF